MEHPHDIPPEQSLIEYPCRFPIKVMGPHSDEFVCAMTLIAQAFEDSFDPQHHLEKRPSRAGNYIGLTVSIHVQNREQLDEIYRTLTTHPLVKYVL